MTTIKFPLETNWHYVTVCFYFESFVTWSVSSFTAEMFGPIEGRKSRAEENAIEPEEGRVC